VRVRRALPLDRGSVHRGREAKFATHSFDQTLGQTVQEVTQHRWNRLVVEPRQGCSGYLADLRGHRHNPELIFFRHRKGAGVQAPGDLALVRVNISQKGQDINTPLGLGLG